MAVTNEERQQNVKQMTIYMSVIIGLLCAYILGYVGSVMDQGKEGFFEALSTVAGSIGKIHLTYAITGKSLTYMFFGLLLGVVIFFFIHNDNIKNESYMMKEIAGTGGFMSKKEMQQYSEKYIHKDPAAIIHYPIETKDWDEEKNKYSQNMIMSDTFCRPINSREILGNNNVLIVGGAGTGKSRFVIKPNVLQMNASYVITDPSGEMIASLGDVLRNNGYKVKIFNTSEMGHSNCYNPIKYIRDEAGVNMVIQCLINNTTKGEGGGDNQFFVDAEKLLYSACLFYLIDYCNNESMKNFAGVMELINSSSVDENNPNQQSPLDRLFNKLPKASLARKFYTAFKQAAGKTLKSIIISCVTRLQPFMTPQVANLTRTDDLELEKMGEERTALFIITPQADRTYSFLASMLYSQLFETLYYIGEQQKARGGSEQLKIPVRCMMDEFANIGEVPEFPSKLATMRKYNISATVVLQDISQIEAMYKDEWKTLVANCSSKVFLGSPEPETLKWFSDQLGKMTVRSKSNSFSEGGKGGSNKSFQYTSREVMTPDELGRMPKEECIVFTQNMRAVRDKKYKYERHPYYSQTADADDRLLYKYKSMSIYDNTKMGSYMNLFVALNESARVRELEEKKGEKIEPTEVKDIELTDEQIEKVYQRYMIECSAKAFDVCDQNVCMFEISAIPAKYLRRLAQMTADAYELDRVLIFVSMAVKGIEEPTVFGFGLERNIRGDHSLADLLKMQQSAGNCIKTADKDGDIMVIAYRSKYEQLREALNKAYEVEGGDTVE